MNQEKKRLHTGEFNGIIIDMKKECDINKKNHTILITNKYDPNIDYYEHKEKQRQLSRIEIRNLEKERELNNGNRKKSI
jgi:hypothetical protein